MLESLKIFLNATLKVLLYLSKIPFDSVDQLKTRLTEKFCLNLLKMLISLSE